MQVMLDQLDTDLYNLYVEKGGTSITFTLQSKYIDSLIKEQDVEYNDDECCVKFEFYYEDLEIRIQAPNNDNISVFTLMVLNASKFHKQFKKQYKELR